MTAEIKSEEVNRIARVLCASICPGESPDVLVTSAPYQIHTGLWVCDLRYARPLWTHFVPAAVEVCRHIVTEGRS